MLRAIIWLICVYLALTIFAGCQGLNQQSGFDSGDWGRRPGRSPKIRAKTYYAAGQLFEYQGKLAQAVARYRQAIEVEPTFLPAHNQMSLVYNTLGKYSQAERILKNALKLAPNEAYLHNNLAFNYILQHRPQDAERELRKALALRPDFKRAKMNLGIVLAKQDKCDQALTYFLEACPPHEANYNLAMVHQARGELELAEICYKRSLALAPRFAPAKKALDAIEKAKGPRTIKVSQLQ